MTHYLCRMLSAFRAATGRSRARSNGASYLRAHGTYPRAHARGSKSVRGAILLAALLALPFAVGAEEPPAASVPEQVQAELAAAGQARRQLAREEQDWAAEKARLELLLSAVRYRAEQLKADAAKADAARADLQTQVDTFTARTDRLARVEAMLDALAERLEQALDALQAEALPGVVPPDTASGVTEPARRFDAAVARLEETERRLGSATVEIVTGRLDGREVTVKLLRAGGAGAWWLTLDGDQAGTARLQDGRLVLDPAAGPEDAQAVARAFAVAEGRAAPDWVLLPANHIQADRE